MIKFLSAIFGFDALIIIKKKASKKIILLVCFCLLLVLGLSFSATFYAFNLILENTIFSVLIALFITLLLLNTYRFIFSISEGGLHANLNFIKIIKYIVKRSVILIVLSIFISKSLEVYIFNDTVNRHLKTYKSNLLNNYDKLQQLSFADQIDNAYKNFEDEIEFDKVIDKDRTIELKNELDRKLAIIDDKIIIDKIAVKKTISASNFFITKIKIVSSKEPLSWVFTIMVIALFLFPIYLFLVHPAFKNYSAALHIINNDLVLKDYNYFKGKYSELMFASIGKPYDFEEKYKDPPFNTLKLESPYKILKKGSLLAWFEAYDK